MESSFMDLSLRHSAMSILEGIQYMFEASENKMEQGRQLCRQAEEAYKAVESLTAVLNQRELWKEAKSMQGVMKKLDFVLEKRGEELSAATDKYLDMKKYLQEYTCQIISEVGSGYYGPIPQDGSIKV
ncbi:MAG: hypothetical protein EOO81_04275 [Oxalobacteraceae bacterium]|nr:MAG: hypothetical protein EOO81_04275 [Oxalobacteraceae bacterium]